MVERGRCGIRRAQVLEERDDDLAEVRGRRAGDHAVEVVGVSLDLHQPLTTAIRAAIEVRVSRLGAIERAGEHFRDFRGSMYGREAVVHLSLWIVQRPARAAT